MKIKVLSLCFFISIAIAANSQDLWTNAKNLQIEGMGWSDATADYTRLPDKYSSVVSSIIWNLSRHSSGVVVKFTVSGTTYVKARWNLRTRMAGSSMRHMTDVCVSGVDLYVKKNGKWLWVNAGQPRNVDMFQEQSLVAELSASETYEMMLYLPLYNGVTDVQIGTNSGANITPAAKSTKKPIVMYGTSIVQGCSASRPGMNAAAMIGREFDVPIVNLGFSGNGTLDGYFGDIMGEIDASAYIIDCLPNMPSFGGEEVRIRTLALVRKLKSQRPDVPIVLVENAPGWGYFFDGSNWAASLRTGLKNAYNVLKTEFVGMHYVEGDELYTTSDGTIDNSHPNDLGMYFYFNRLKTTIQQLPLIETSVNKIIDPKDFFLQNGNTIKLLQHGTTEIFNVEGKRVYSGVNKSTINLENISGAFVVFFKSNDGKMVSQKLIL